MNLKGKKVLFLGDSITEGVGASEYAKSYVPIFAELSGADVKNYGIGGTRIAKQLHQSENPRWDQDFISRVDMMESDANIVVVFGGTNDFGHGDAKIGDFNSRSEYTFYGAMHILCEKLINKYPNADIIFVTPLHRETEDIKIKENGMPSEIPLAGYVSIIKEIAGYYGLPVMDLFHTSGMQPKVGVVKKEFMPDGLHPSDKGAKRIAEKLYGFLMAM